LFVAGAIALVTIYVFCHKRSTRSGGGSVFRKGQGSEHPGGPNIAQEYSFAEVIAMTNQFNQILGEGSFGTVCYGKLPNGQEVAVKRLSGISQQGAHEFYNEVDLLSKVHHKNLVALVGYCQEGKEQILIYEYMPSGTVRESLYGTAKARNNPISWNTRLDIALNAAKGLEYLHTGCVPSIIHRDVKTSNILLSANMTAKVADFGLSKAVINEGVSHISTVVKGTTGYLDPEYYTRQKLTDKSDVFSFGVVLLELICGRPPIDTTSDDRMEWNIGEWVKPHIEAGAINNIIDKAMEDNYMLESIWKVAEIAVMSIAPIGINRPTMRQVVSGLREAIEIQTNMQSSYDVSSGSMQSNACFAPTIAKPTTTTMARNNNNNHIQGSSPLFQCTSSSSETNHLQTNFQASSSNPNVMDIPYAR
jgi:serine/threonine protein kinase